MEGLEHEADFLAANFCLLLVIKGCDVAAVQFIDAGSRPIEQPDQVEQRGFSGTRRPHDGYIVAS